MGRRMILMVGAALAVLGATAMKAVSQDSTVEMKVFAATKNWELTAELPKGSDWCKPEVVFTIRGVEDTPFKEGETDDQGRQGRFLLQKLLGVVRIGLQKECPQATSVVFNGFVHETFVYRGHASKDGPQGDWVLVELPINLAEAPEAPPPAVRFEEAQATVAGKAAIAACDALAAHPDDPQKPAGIAGVSDDQMEAGKAAEVCEIAVEAEPDNARLKYQLGRAMMLYGHAAEGAELITDAAEADYPPALASLGDITLYGLLNDEPDPEAAKDLYTRAAEAGFKPAAQLAAQIVADPQEDKSQSVGNTINFAQADRAALLLKGEALRSNGAEFVTMLAYGSSFLGGVTHQCQDQDSTLDPKKVAAVLAKRSGVGKDSFDNSLKDGARQAMQQAGMDDGYALAFTKGCQAPELAAARATLAKTLN